MTQVVTVQTSGQLPSVFPSDSEWAMLKEQVQTAVKSGFLPKAIDTPEKAIAIALDEYTEAEAERIVDSTLDDPAFKQKLVAFVSTKHMDIYDLGFDAQINLQANAERVFRNDRDANNSGDNYANGDEHPVIDEHEVLGIGSQ